MDKYSILYNAWVTLSNVTNIGSIVIQVYLPGGPFSINSCPKMSLPNMKKRQLGSTSGVMRVQVNSRVPPSFTKGSNGVISVENKHIFRHKSRRIQYDQHFRTEVTLSGSMNRLSRDRIPFYQWL